MILSQLHANTKLENELLCKEKKERKKSFALNRPHFEYKMFKCVRTSNYIRLHVSIYLHLYGNKLNIL